MFRGNSGPLSCLKSFSYYVTFLNRISRVLDCKTIDHVPVLKEAQLSKCFEGIADHSPALNLSATIAYF